MEELNNAVDNFIKSIENNDNINMIQNNLSLLIGQVNIFYYKYNFLNDTTSCEGTNNNITLGKLEEISTRIRNIYPKFIELRKKQFKTHFIDKLKCDQQPNILSENINKTNKMQSMITNLSELLYFDPNMQNNTNLMKVEKFPLMLIMLIALIVLILIIVFIVYLYKKNKKSLTTSEENNSPA
jgi:hypothetical protein